MISRAIKLTTLRLVLEQIATTAVVFLLFLAWLRMPDSSWVYVLGTVIVSVLLAAMFGAGETRIFCKLTGTTPTRSTYVRGTIVLLLAFALWYGWDALISGVSIKHDELWAGYWNSRFPHGMRNFFSYRHLQLWLEWFWAVLEWMGTGLIAVCAFHAIATPAAKPAIKRNLRSIVWWITFVVGLQVMNWLTGKITGWTPGHGLGVESLSLVLRMLVVIVIDAVLTVFLLATFATFSRDGGD